MFCKFCGTQLSDDAKICTACGHILADPAFENARQEAPKYEAPLYQAAPPTEEYTVKASMIALIIGVVSAIFSLFSGVAEFPAVMALLGMIATVILGVVGLVKSIKRRYKKGIVMAAISHGLAFVAYVGAMTGLFMQY